MNKNDLNRIYSSISANSDMKRRIAANAENPVSVDAPKRRSPVLQAAAAVSLCALTAVIAVTSARFGSEREIETVPETGTDAAFVDETTVTEHTISAPTETEIQILETAVDEGELTDLPLKIIVGEKIYMLSDNVSELNSILFDGIDQEPKLGEEVAGGNGLRYIEGNKNPNIYGLEADGEIHFYRYFALANTDSNRLASMLQTSGKVLTSIELVTFNHAYEDEWYSSCYPTLTSENGENLLDSDLMSIIEELPVGDKFLDGIDVNAGDISSHIISPRSYYLTAKYASGEIMAFPISPEANVISAFSQNYELTDKFIDTFLGDRYRTAVAEDNKYYERITEQLLKQALEIEERNKQMQENVEYQKEIEEQLEQFSPPYDPNPQPTNHEPKSHEVSIFVTDKGGNYVNGLCITCQAIKYIEGSPGYEIDNDKGGYMPGAALTCGDVPTVRTLTDGCYLLTVSDMMVNSEGKKSKRNEMQFEITIDENADDFSIELVWEHPTPDELNAADTSKAVTRLLDENGDPLFGYWVILRPEGFDGSNLAEGYSGAWGGYVIGATDKNGEAVWHCPIAGKYNISAYCGTIEYKGGICGNDVNTLFMNSGPMTIEITDINGITTAEFSENGKYPTFDESDFIPE